MKKTIAALATGLLLVAGQAVAQSQSAATRVSDRIGAPAGESSEFAGVPLAAILLTAGAIAIVVVGTDDDSDSD